MIFHKPIMARQQLDNNGFIALLAVIIIGAIATTTALGLLTLSLSAQRNSLAQVQFHQAHGLATACTETALNKLRASAAYAGSEIITFATGQCEILAVTSTAGVYTIKTQGEVDSVLAKIKAQALRAADGAITIQSWQNVADF